jgi:hypothetical protein
VNLSAVATNGIRYFRNKGVEQPKKKYSAIWQKACKIANADALFDQSRKNRRLRSLKTKALVILNQK